MNTDVTLDSKFYDLTKDQMEALCPSDLRAIVRKAFDNKQSGMGTGPTMQEVIDHYYDQRNYYLFRTSIPSTPELLEGLDQLMQYKSLGSEGCLPWRVPSIYEGSDQSHGIGAFDFKFARKYYPKIDALLTEHGFHA